MIGYTVDYSCWNFNFRLENSNFHLEGRNFNFGHENSNSHLLGRNFNFGLKNSNSHFEGRNFDFSLENSNSHLAGRKFNLVPPLEYRTEDKKQTFTYFNNSSIFQSNIFFRGHLHNSNAQI